MSEFDNTFTPTFLTAKQELSFDFSNILELRSFLFGRLGKAAKKCMQIILSRTWSISWSHRLTFAKESPEDTS